MRLYRDVKLKEINFGDHICLLYQTRDEYRSVALSYIKEGIYNNEKVVCVIYEYPRETLIMDLRKEGIDVEELMASNQLEIRGVDDVYWEESRFNPVETLDYWEMKGRTFKQEGFHGMRVMAEMIFGIYDEYGMTKLIEYEMLSNKSNLEDQIHLCIFNRESFPSFVLEEIVQSHNVIINGMDLIKPNPYHLNYNKQIESYNLKKSIRSRLNLDTNNDINVLDTNNWRKNRDAVILKHVLGSTGDGVWEWYIESNEVYINEGFFNTVGYKQEHLSIGTNNLLELIHPEDLHGFKNQFKKCLKNKIDYIDYELRIRGKSDEWIWFRIRGVSVEKNDTFGENIKMVGIYIDISDTRILADELDQKNSNKKLQTDFISNLSHELRTPLNIILGSLQLQDLYIKNDKSSKYVNNYEKINKRMKQNSYRLLRLLNNVIDMSKIESDFYSINLENYDIKMLIEKIVGSIEDYVRNAGLEVKFVSNVDKLIIAFDPEKMEKVLLNILSNSIKFTEPGGKILVDFRAYEDIVEISIKDTGIGIPKDKLDTIFNRFKQVNSLKHRANEGSGIGLSLVKAWVNAHEGDISVNSNENEGTEFVIKLPNKTIESDICIEDKMTCLRDINVERLNIEFSDIYS